MARPANPASTIDRALRSDLVDYGDEYQHMERSHMERSHPESSHRGAGIRRRQPGQRRRGAARGGFTLIEAIISLAVIVLILPMIALMLVGRTLDQQAEVQAVAFNVARQELETLRALNYLDRPSDGTPRSFPIPTAVQMQFPNYSYSGATANFTGTYAVLPGAISNTQEIRVTVSWIRSGATGITSSVTLDTLNAKGAGE